MGGSGSKAKGVWPFSGGGAGGDASSDGNEQSVARMRGSRTATPFVFTRRRWVTAARQLPSPASHPGYLFSSCVVGNPAIGFNSAFSLADFILKA